MTAREHPAALIDRMLAGDRRALARIITTVENRSDDVVAVLAAVHDHMRVAPVIGVTGPPGAGKSTLADRLIAAWRARGDTVAGILVDPSSPFSGGAVLGDRIRMQEHSGDDGVFLRSLGTRGVHGGISRATHQVANVFAAAGYDRIFIETVGVGQTELDIMTLADTTVVVLVPEAGDAVQTMKAGLLEIADVFVVNKADRPGADKMAQDLLSMVELGVTPTEDELKHHGMTAPVAKDTGADAGHGAWSTPVLLTQAVNDDGVGDVVHAVDAHLKHLTDTGKREARRRALRRRDFIEVLIEDYGKRVDASARDGDLKELLAAVEEGTENPYEALDRAREILAQHVR